MGETAFATQDMKGIHVYRSRRGQAAAEARRDHR
jgi:hypothetical protein